MGKKNPYNLITMLSCFCHIEFCSVCTLTHTHTKMAFPSQQKIRVHEYMLPCTDTNSLSLVFVVLHDMLSKRQWSGWSPAQLHLAKDQN